MDRVFLDANVLFSAAYREPTGLKRLWQLPETRLLSSLYAIEESRRNLPDSLQHWRLDELMLSIEIVAEAPASEWTRYSLLLPDKDIPILASSVCAGATHLLTGDVRHFGPLFGSTVGGVVIVLPAEYLRRRDKPPAGATP